MKIKLTETYAINENGELFKNGKIVNYKKRKYLRVGNEVQQLAYWIGKHFVQGYFEGAVIDHIDSNPLNNNPSNLQWITQSQNTQKRSDFKNTITQKILEHLPNATHKDIVRENNWYKRHGNKFRWEK